MKPEDLAKSGTEHGEQTALFAWAALEAKRLPALASLFAIPNGGQRGDGTTRGRMIAGAKMKAEGVRPGVPDLMLPWPRPVHQPVLNPAVMWHGCFIEMKTKDGAVTDDQKRWLTMLKERQYYVQVCYSWKEAQTALLWYLEG